MKYCIVFNINGNDVKSIGSFENESDAINFGLTNLKVTFWTTTVITPEGYILLNKEKSK
jgi:hypothetical protein